MSICVWSRFIHVPLKADSVLMVNAYDKYRICTSSSFNPVHTFHSHIPLGYTRGGRGGG